MIISSQSNIYVASTMNDMICMRLLLHEHKRACKTIRYKFNSTSDIIFAAEDSSTAGITKFFRSLFFHGKLGGYWQLDGSLVFLQHNRTDQKLPCSPTHTIFCFFFSLGEKGGRGGKSNYIPHGTLLLPGERGPP